MKLLLVTNHSYMFWRFRRELTEALLREHEVVLSTPFVGHEDDFAALGVRCIETDLDRRGVDPRTDGKLFRFYRQLLRDEAPDLVVTYSIKPNIYMGLACRLGGVPYCAHVQGLGTAFERPALAQVVTLLYRAALRRARTVFFENADSAAVFRRKHILPASKQTVLRGAGINLSDYPAVPYPDHAVPHLLYLGRIMREKGMDELFAALRRLSEEKVPVVLDLVGFFEDEYKAEVEALAAAGVAVFHGFQQDPRPFYAAADCVVLPSYHEGMSNVLLEAAATGRPLVTSDIPGCREAVEDGVTGLLCAPRDADSLYDALRRMLALSPAKRAAMGAAGHAKMAREFSRSEVVAQTCGALFKEGLA